MKSEKDKGRLLWCLVFLMFLSVFIYSAASLTGIYADAKGSKDSFAELSRRMAQAESQGMLMDGEADSQQGAVTEPGLDPEPESGLVLSEGAAAAMGSTQAPDAQEPGAASLTDEQAQVKAKIVVPKAILKGFRELYRENPDLGGWVTIAGTVLDYPVMYTPSDPEKYLKRGFNGKQSAHGVPFIGKGSTINPRSDNIILYGHHMQDGTMFQSITKYESMSYWQKHPTIEFSTLYEKGTYEIFAVFRTDIYKAPSLRCYRFINALDEADFDDFIADIRRVSLYDTGVEVSYGDKLLTLSTCNYHTYDGRFVIIARQK